VLPICLKFRAHIFLSMDLFKSKIFPVWAKVKKAFADFWSALSGIFRRRPRPVFSVDNSELDKKLVYSLSKSKIPSLNQLRYFRKALSKKEIWLINFLLFFIILNVAWLGFSFGRQHLRVVPIGGGQYSEGAIGSPVHINPLYSTLNDVDNDLTHLIFSSLFKYDVNGKLIKDLADDYQISEDGKTYTVKIKDDVKWQNGSKLTADDIVFTFTAIKDPAYNSPLRASISGVTIEKKDDRTVIFTLPERYSPFPALLTFGILPAEIWGEIPPESAFLAEPNLKPIGSGPFEFKSLVKDKSGNVKSYTLMPNKNYYGKKPFLKEIIFKFYADSTEAGNALSENSIDGLNNLSFDEQGGLLTKNSLNFYQLNLPRIKGIFFNKDKNPFLKDVKVRQALAFATPREDIINQVMNGQAKAAHGPLPDSNFVYDDTIEKYDFDSAHAASLLESAGWKTETISAEEVNALIKKRDTATTSKSVLTDEEKKIVELGPGAWRALAAATTSKSSVKTTSKSTAKTSAPAAKTYLEINLTVTDGDEDGKIAGLIKTAWEKIGVKVNVVVVAVKEIQASVIKPKNYEAVLFSEAVGNDPDVYVFWHSSQAGAGGLNLANYKNEDADASLEEGRQVSDPAQRIADYKKFQGIVANDAPAIFLFSPEDIYAQNKKIKGFAVKNISANADRFADVTNWYTKTGERLEW